MGGSLYDVAWANGATAWDTAYANGWTEWTGSGAASTAKMPCYAPGSPVGAYLGGDQAYMMMAWGEGKDPTGAPCRLPCSAAPACSRAFSSCFARGAFAAALCQRPGGCVPAWIQSRCD